MKPMNERLAWLAGILDGEGYIGATLCNAKKGRKPSYLSLRFQIRVANTDAAMINEIASIADSLNLKYFLTDVPPRDKVRHKEMFLIHFHGSARVEPLIRAVLPWLITKRAVAEHILRMIGHRKAMPYNHSLRENTVLMSQLESLRQLNHRGPAPWWSKKQTREWTAAKDPSESKNSDNVVGAQRQAEQIPTSGDAGTVIRGK